MREREGIKTNERSEFSCGKHLEPETQTLTGRSVELRIAPVSGYAAVSVHLAKYVSNRGRLLNVLEKGSGDEVVEHKTGVGSFCCCEQFINHNSKKTLQVQTTQTQADIISCLAHEIN